MKHLQKLTAIFLLAFSALSYSPIQSYSYYSSYHSYSSWEVFDMVERNDVYGIESWLRTYPRTVDIRNHVGQTPFLRAVQLQYYTIAHKLLLAGANRYAIDSYGRSAHMYVRDFNYSYSDIDYYSSGSSEASSVLKALGVGLVAGLITYALTSDSSSNYSYNSSSSYDTYCPGCGMVRYRGESLYCSYCSRS